MRCIGYMKGEKSIGSVTDQRGNVIGKYQVTSSWRTPKSHVSNVMYQLVVKIGSTFYTARSAGGNMAIVGKRKAKQDWYRVGLRR